MKRDPLKIFYSYAHEDEALRDRIDAHLKLPRHQHLVVGWHDRHIIPATEWNEVIGDMLASADIVLLLVSGAFMASIYVRDFEIPEALKAHEMYEQSDSFREFAKDSSQTDIAKRDWLWRTYLVSDHLPLWAEINIEAPVLFE